MTVKIRETSRLKNARLITIDGVEHWEYPEYPVIDVAPDDIKYKVDRNDRIDKIATRFYGSPELWWIIAIANGFELLPNDLNSGDTIRIPSGRRVFSEILRRPTRGVEGR